MDRVNHKTIAIFDTVGSYFIDTFYNVLYLSACERVRLGDASSIIIEYRKTIDRYLNGIQRPELYNKALHNLSIYYAKYSDKNTYQVDPTNNFIAEFSRCFVPVEYYRDLDVARKRSIVSDVLIAVIHELGIFIGNAPFFVAAIDHHQDATNITELQEFMVSALETQQAKYGAKFVAVSTRPNHFINAEQADELMNQLREKQQLISALQIERSQASMVIEGLMARLSTAEQQLNTLEQSAQDYGRTKPPHQRYQRPANNSDALFRTNSSQRNAHREKQDWQGKTKGAARTPVTTTTHHQHNDNTSAPAIGKTFSDPNVWPPRLSIHEHNSSQLPGKSSSVAAVPSLAIPLSNEANIGPLSPRVSPITTSPNSRSLSDTSSESSDHDHNNKTNKRRHTEDELFAKPSDESSTTAHDETQSTDDEYDVSEML